MMAVLVTCRGVARRRERRQEQQGHAHQTEYSSDNQPIHRRLPAHECNITASSVPGHVIVSDQQEPSTSNFNVTYQAKHPSCGDVYTVGALRSTGLFGPVMGYFGHGLNVECVDKFPERLPQTCETA